MRPENLQKYCSDFSHYTELRLQENRFLNILLLNGNIATNDHSSIQGLSARVYRDGSWGFASTPGYCEQGVADTLQKANSNATFLATRERRKSQALPATPSSTQHDFATRKARLPQKELIGFIQELEQYLVKTYPDLTSRTLSLHCLDMEKSLVTSDDSRSFSLVPKTHISASLSTEKGGDKTDLRDCFGGLGHFEDLFQNPSDCFSRLDTLYENLMKKAEGIIPNAGHHQVILDSDLAGILAHEAIGHTTEADLVMAGSVAADYLNQRVASPLVTLVDFAHTALGKTCPVPVYTDDEGTEARDAVIIEEGILKGYMHNKESALTMEHAPTGNARAWNFSDEPLIRMRNTAILPGTSQREEMISSIEDGYYLAVPSNGEADATSEFTFSVTMGYEIKRGQLGRAIKNTTISGIAFDMLKTITMVSDEMHWVSSGLCGKAQPMSVGMGGPAIKCQVNLGGR